MDFENCQLDLSSFYKLNFSNRKFQSCSLKEVDFTETNLKNNLLENCNLQGALFFGSNLEKVDFRTSYNFSIDPENNNIKKAKFSLTAIHGLLEKHQIEIL